MGSLTGYWQWAADNLLLAAPDLVSSFTQILLPQPAFKAINSAQLMRF